MPAELPMSVDRALRLARVDFSPAYRQPSVPRLVAATAAALGGSLFAAALLVRFGEQFFPSLWYYPHFQVGDYGKLTVLGVIVACLGWPIVTRISSVPRWLFFRLAIALTLVLLLPDAYLLVKGQSAEAVLVLVLMHVAVALITYNSLVHIAKVRPLAAAAGRYGEDGEHGEHYPGDGYDEWDSGRRHSGYGARGHYGTGDRYGPRDDYGDGGRHGARDHDDPPGRHDSDDRYDEGGRRHAGQDTGDDGFYERYFRQPDPPGSRYPKWDAADRRYARWNA